jgi:hypothetical protein
MGGFAGLTTFLFVLLWNGSTMQGASWTTSFYAAQARSFLHGEWSIPGGVLGFEGFRHAGRWYMYFGPFPALLRVPALWIAPGAANRMTQASMLVAWVVAVGASVDLLWRARRLARPSSPMSRLECVAVAAWAFAIGGGSVLVFLASRAWVYHEAEIWGTALAVASFDAIVAWVSGGRRRALVLASGLATLTVCTRASVGLGPISALGILGIASLAPRLCDWFGLRRTTGRLSVRTVGLFVAAVVPALVYSWTNWSKFGTLFVFPTDQQLMSLVNPQRRLFLARSGGSYFGMQFAPTTAVAYLRPLGLAWRSLAPWFALRQQAPLRGATFDVIEPTASVPSTMPVLAIAACIGIGLLLWPRAKSRGWSAFRAPVLGALIGAVTVFPFGYIAQRYLADMLPLLIVAGAVGMQYLLGAAEHATKRTARNLMAIIGSALLFFSVAVNVALAADYHWFGPWTQEQEVAPAVALQYRLSSRTPGDGRPPYVVDATRLPYPPSARGTMYVVGDCVGAYWSAGDVRALASTPWLGVARTRASGQYVMRIRPPAVRTRQIQPVLVRGRPGSLQAIVMDVTPDRSLRFGFFSEGHEDLPRGTQDPEGFFWGPWITLTGGSGHAVTAVMDPFDGQVRVTLDDAQVFRLQQFQLTPEQSLRYVFPTDRVTIGRNPGGIPATAAFTGAIQLKPDRRAPVCADLAR